MIKWFKKYFVSAAEFHALQKSYDLRALLNHRLSQENKRLRQDCSRLAPIVRPKTTKYIEEAIAKGKAKAVEQTFLARVEAQRQRIICDFMRDYVTESQFLHICDEVSAMTDEQVLAYRKPRPTKRPKAKGGPNV